jgi:hypothetical protein
MVAKEITDITQVTPVWLTSLLQEKGHLHQGMVTEVHETKSIKTNLSVAYHLTIGYTDVENLPSVPTQLFLKISKPDFSWGNKEVEFYNVLVPVMLGTYSDVDWPFLTCYDAVYSAETGISHVLLEDLSATYFTLDSLMPPTQTHCNQVIDAYALFHTYWWEHPRLGQDIGELLTDETIDGFLNSIQKKFSDFVDFMGERLSEAQRDTLESVVSAWPARRRERVIQGKGITLVHRDPHPRNFLYPYDTEKAMVKLIDWQSWRVDTGTDDLAYLMACHWPFEQRVQVELGLMKRYHKRLVALGVNNFNWEDCWYDYRASIIRCLFFLIGAWSPAQWERGGWWDKVKRGIVAFEYWNCAELLAD